jgi:HSP20 family protein
MAIVRYANRNPWTDFDRLTDRLTSMFGPDWMPAPAPADRNWFPAVNVEEDADRLLLTAELPGLVQDDVEIQIENDVLTIRGEKVDERREGNDTRYHVWERRYGAFERALRLPRTVKADQITADFKNGVLSVNMPKAAEAKGRRIAIGKAK